MIVTPGYQFTSDTETVTREKLNLLAKPTVALEAGDIAPENIDLEALAETLGGGIAGANYLANGNFAEPLWSRGSTPVSCPATLRTFRADDWWARPTGAAITYERADGGPDFKSLNSAKLTGATSVTTVEFGQDVPAHLAAVLRTKSALSVYLYNGSGSAFTPSLLVYTADAENAFAAATLRSTNASSTSCTNAAWTKVTWLLDFTTAPTNFENGAQFVIQFPNGALSSGAKTVQIAQAKLEAAQAATLFIPDPRERANETAASTGGIPRNFLHNATLADALWFSTSLTAKANVDQFPAYGWMVRPSGADGAVISRATNQLPNAITQSALKVTGATSVSVVDVGQWVDSLAAAQTQGQNTFSIYLYNNTGGNFTPSARIETCDVVDGFDVTTLRATQDLDVCANGAWTLLNFHFTGSDYANYTNGFRISIRIPDGSLSSNAKSVYFAQARLEIGSDLAAFQPVEPEREGLLVGQSLNLKGTATGADTNATFTASQVVLKADDGRPMIARNVSVTLNLSTSGLNGLDTGSAATNCWYTVYLVSNGLTFGCVAVKENDSNSDGIDDAVPVWPTGYVYRAQISSVFYNSSNFIRQFAQTGSRIYQAPYAIKNGANSHGTSYSVISNAAGDNMSYAVPLRATAVWGNAGVGPTNVISHAAQIEIAATSAGGVGNQAINVGGTGTLFNNFFAGGSWTSLIVTPQQIYWRTGDTTTAYRVEICGFQL